MNKFAAAVLGLVLVVFGVVFGATAPNRSGFSCGSVFSPRDFTVAELTDAMLLDRNEPGLVRDAANAHHECSGALSDRRPFVWVGIAIGGALIAGAGIAAAAGAARRAEARTEDTTAGASGDEPVKPNY